MLPWMLMSPSRRRPGCGPPCGGSSGPRRRGDDNLGVDVVAEDIDDLHVEVRRVDLAVDSGSSRAAHSLEVPPDSGQQRGAGANSVHRGPARQADCLRPVYSRAPCIQGPSAMTPKGNGPERKAREKIDAALTEAGWIVQHRDEINLAAGRGVAVREFALAHGHGFADYLLFVDGKAVGVLEAKPQGHTLSGVEIQVRKYATGLPDGLRPPVEPLPFLYLSTGTDTKFTNLLDPDPRSRRVFQVHQPGTLADWLNAETLDDWVKDHGGFTAAEATRPSSLRGRLRAMPPVEKGFLYPNQFEAVTNLE